MNQKEKMKTEKYILITKYKNGCKKVSLSSVRNQKRDSVDTQHGKKTRRCLNIYGYPKYIGQMVEEYENEIQNF